nr:HAMP domain-containing sensor histidine kinase [Argonema antarcticum]
MPTLSEVLAQSTENGAQDAVSQTSWKAATETDTQQPSKGRIALQRLKSEQEWCGARAALEDLLRSTLTSSHSGDADEAMPQGLILAGPVAVLSDPAINSGFQTWIFSTQLANPGVWMPFQLPPAQEDDLKKHNYGNLLPLLPVDPLAAEQFCLILTASFSLVMVLGEDPTYQPAFMFSFDPEVVQRAWVSLRNRILLTCPHYINQLDGFSLQFPPTAPDYRTVMEFTRLLLKHLPQDEVGHGEQRTKGTSSPGEIPSVHYSRSDRHSDDVELLQAFAHEVRTPLTTIRTLTRLLLRRKDLASDIIKRLEIIDRECTEQIDRMELLFQAAELETSTKETHPIHLTPMSLAQVFQQSLPRWEKQASRRNQTLDAILPQYMPQVVSDPTMLDRVLTGLIENFTRNLPAGSHIQVEVTPAGDRLKLRLQPHSGGVSSECENTLVPQAADSQLTRKSIGQLLIFQPETGSLSLNHTVTKNLFQALGGKLIVRQRPQQGEVLTIFLPLSPTSTDIRWQRESYS